MPDATKAPGLQPGQLAPDFKLKTSTNKDFQLYEQLKNSAVLLVVYRGGWCPYCNTQLHQLQEEVAASAEAAGVSLVALAVDRPQYLADTAKEHQLDFTLVSDPDLKALTAYNLLAPVSDEVFQKYETKGFDLEGRAGRDHHIIAVPAVILIGQDKKLRYQFADRNYKVRAPIDEILQAFKALATP